ncbi:MAG: hypothetical protein WAU78_16500 [Roseiarcus sp.]
MKPLTLRHIAIAGVALFALAGAASANLPSLSNWEQALVQQLTGAYGVPVANALGGVPAASGLCAIKTQKGGQAAGSFVDNGGCSTSTVILTFASPAPTGFACKLDDLSTPSNKMLETAYSTTTATLTGSMTDGDLVAFACLAF